MVSRSLANVKYSRDFADVRLELADGVQRAEFFQGLSVLFRIFQKRAPPAGYTDDGGRLLDVVDDYLSLFSKEPQRYKSDIVAFYRAAAE